MQWSPHNRSMFGTAAEDSLLNIWDYGRVWKLSTSLCTLIKLFCAFSMVHLTSSQLFFFFHVKINAQVGKVQTGSEGKRSEIPAGLFFRHAGHRYGSSIWWLVTVYASLQWFIAF